MAKINNVSNHDDWLEFAVNDSRSREFIIIVSNNNGVCTLENVVLPKKVIEDENEKEWSGQLLYEATQNIDEVESWLQEHDYETGDMSLGWFDTFSKTGEEIPYDLELR